MDNETTTNPPTSSTGNESNQPTSNVPTTTATTSSNPPRPPSTSGEEEQVEIKVEEGYATRQMDEYFRQTIAAIKEELTKKLETKEAEDGAKATSRGRFDSGSGEYYEEDDLAETGDQVELRKHHPGGVVGQSKDDYYCEKCRDNLNRPRNNRAYIYQSLMGKEKSDRSPIVPSLVLIGSMLNQFVIEGLCYNYGNLFDVIQREFRLTSRLIATLPGAFLLTFFLLLAPISVFLSKQFGTRRIAILGTFITTISLLVAAFFSNIVVFILFYGVFTGKKKIH